MVDWKKVEPSTKESFSLEEQKALLSLISLPDKYVLLNLIKKYSGEKTSLPIVNEESIKDTRTRVNSMKKNDNFPTEDEINNWKKEEINKIIQKQLNDPNVSRRSRLTLVIGSAGAGKSTTSEHISKDKRAFHADADHIKKRIAEDFDCDINHDNMHNISTDIIKEVIAAAAPHKLDVVLEKIGEKPHKIYKQIMELEALKYSIGLNLVHVCEEIARTRNNDRANELMAKNEPPRFVEDELLKEFGEGPFFSYLFLAVRCPEKFSYCKAFSNEGPLRELPIPLHTLSVKDGKILGPANDPCAKKVDEQISSICLKSTVRALKSLNEEREDASIKYLTSKMEVLCSDDEKAKKEVKDSIERIRVKKDCGVECMPEEAKLLDLYDNVQTNKHGALMRIYDPQNIDDRELLEKNEDGGLAITFVFESVVGKPHNTDRYNEPYELVNATKDKVGTILGLSKEVSQ
ncbi:MAG: zeta toxin family protein [Christensenellaceae bacterium]|jgi:dephospho-CoA kinase|nr:zeta toxin family protein [Christensenellaceae bacterium]